MTKYYLENNAQCLSYHGIYHTAIISPFNSLFMRKIVISWRNKNKFKNWFPEIPSLDVKKQEHFHLFIFLLHRGICNREHSFLRWSDNSCFYVTFCVTFYRCMSCFTLDIDLFAIVLIRLFTLKFWTRNAWE